jgi:hypothetical protein
MPYFCVRLFGVILFIALSFNGWTSEIQCQAGKVCRIVSTSLPLRALPRDLSNMYSKPDIASTVISHNIKAFKPLYVFEKKNVDLSDPAFPKGWYQVGENAQAPLGWMQTKDVLEWQHALVVLFTPPGSERRHPVLMFKSKDALMQLVEAVDRKKRTQAIYAGLNAVPPKVPDSVISVEPARFVDKVFYLLPVLDSEQVDLFYENTRILQISTVVPGNRADENSPDIVENPMFILQAMEGSQVVGDKIAKIANSVASSKVVEVMPPRDIIAWVIDRDLVNPNLSALEVRVLLTRTDMDNLISSLNILLNQMKWATVTPMTFFTRLQAVVTQAIQDEDITLKAAQRVIDTGFLPAWIASLPYRSAILKMRGERFLSLSDDERARFLKEIESKLEDYRKLVENKALWVALDQRDSEFEYVYLLPLSALP